MTANDMSVELDEAPVLDVQCVEDDMPDSDDAFEKAKATKTLRRAKSADATQIYLSEIGYSSLLTAEEEVHYARLALKGDEAARKK